jgi:hypothetical protein
MSQGILQNLHPRFKSGRRLQFLLGNLKIREALAGTKRLKWLYRWLYRGLISLA